MTRASGVRMTGVIGSVALLALVLIRLLVGGNHAPEADLPKTSGQTPAAAAEAVTDSSEPDAGTDGVPPAPSEPVALSVPPTIIPAAGVEPPFESGHFPGIEVRFEPGTHRPTPPPGTPRTPPRETEIILPDGRRFTGATVDESWRIPLKSPPAPTDP